MKIDFKSFLISLFFSSLFTIISSYRLSSHVRQLNNTSITPRNNTSNCRECPSTYIIEDGDTLDKISKKFNVTIKSLINTNKMENLEVINRGQKLIIPCPEDVIPCKPKCPFNYTVQSGDTLTSISIKTNVAIEELIRNNRIDNNQGLVVGQVIVIPCPVQNRNATVRYPNPHSNGSSYQVVNLFGQNLIVFAIIIFMLIDKI